MEVRITLEDGHIICFEAESHKQVNVLTSVHIYRHFRKNAPTNTQAAIDAALLLGCDEKTIYNHLIKKSRWDAQRKRELHSRS
jgi:hypothetical protein